MAKVYSKITLYDVPFQALRKMEPASKNIGFNINAKQNIEDETTVTTIDYICFSLQGFKCSNNVFCVATLSILVLQTFKGEFENYGSFVCRELSLQVWINQLSNIFPMYHIMSLEAQN